MRRDDVEHALAALAAEVPAPRADAGAVVASGQNRIRRRRVTIAAALVVVVATAVTVGAVARTDEKESSASNAPISTTAVGGKPSSEIAAPTALEAWKCRNPIEYTADGGRSWRATELAGVRDGGLSCTAVAGGTAWAVAQSRATDNWQVIRVRNGGANVDTYDFP